jgi:hypothetical protein
MASYSFGYTVLNLRYNIGYKIFQVHSRTFLALRTEAKPRIG